MLSLTPHYEATDQETNERSYTELAPPEEYVAAPSISADTAPLYTASPPLKVALSATSRPKASAATTSHCRGWKT
jgi:hypothetical protein